MAKKKEVALISAEMIERSILLLRGEKVMIDADLAALYDVETKQLVRAVKRGTSIGFPATSRFSLRSKSLRT